MRIPSVLFMLPWAASVATASACRPTRVSSSSIASSLTSSVSSSAAPAPSQPIGVNLLGDDIDLVDNAAGHWTFETDYPDQLVLHTCGDNTPANDCVVFQNLGTSTPSLFTASFAYTATTLPGAQYTFSFAGNAFGIKSPLPGTFYCFATNVADPGAATTQFSLDSLDADGFIPESLSFEATGTSSVIECFYGNTADAVAVGFASFSLVRTA